MSAEQAGRAAGDSRERELTRRRLLALTGAGALAISGLADAMRAIADAAEALPPLPLSPDHPDVRASIAAFADTIVPGPAGGADREPGALEAGAMEEIYDDFYGASGTFPVLHLDLQATTLRMLGRPVRFDLGLPYGERERILIDRLETPTEGGGPLYVLYQGVAALVYLTYYGTARSNLGPRYIGFPPHSRGYWPHHSYRVRFRGMTRDGNFR